jgi:hypothetical protein
MHAPATTVAVGSQVFCTNRCSGGLAGYADVNDAERLCRDPVMRWVVVNRAIVGSGASASQMGRFETKWRPPKNLSALTDRPGQ